MDKIKVLIADDDLVFLRLTSSLLSDAGYAVAIASSVEICEQSLARDKYDIMMLDMCFPALQDGFGLLSAVQERYPELLILMISGSGHIPDAVSAVKNGAIDFIEKPIDSNHLILKLGRLSDAITLKTQLKDMQITAIGMRGNSAAIHTVFDDIVKAAHFDCPVLISGETGVGKELAAVAVHRLSKFGNKDLTSINCASVPKGLFEAELFGYESGAFTGAVKARKGYFEYANNNSLFMDEISQLPIEVLAKLLRVVSECEIQKLGGKISKINTRIISASNQNLEAMCDAGTFRKDLLYRLNTIHIHIPPLRHRIEDIPLLASYFASEFCSRNHITPKSLSSGAKAWLCEQKWEGNVRELKNAVERAVIFTHNDHLAVVDFTTNTSSGHKPPKSGSLREAVTSFEKAYIEHTLKEFDYNIRKSAEALHMDRSNLFKKLSALGIDLKK
ncbi:MAG: sigma-54 dependent transcriptional regulator [Candidatus Cloacimonetes bacterium]|nr:sigma-54 dependent transcriptional regulator [Candidatus Cloacimonadota bacterium]